MRPEIGSSGISTPNVSSRIRRPEKIGDREQYADAAVDRPFGAAAAKIDADERGMPPR